MGPNNWLLVVYFHFQFIIIYKMLQKLRAHIQAHIKAYCTALVLYDFFPRNFADWEVATAIKTREEL